MEPFNLTPPPNVLAVLARTSMKPIDALCELVDNAIDAFADINLDELRDQSPLIDINLPSLADLNKGAGMIRVRDNGPGMTAKEAERALTAGYSSRNDFDRLGLFGMGLNIATSKFSQTTRLITAKANSEFAVVVDVNLPRLVQQGSYEVQPYQVAKTDYFAEEMSGTIIELDKWWPKGDSNSDFPRKLVRYGRPKLREQLGRRYATLLQGRASVKFSMKISGDECVPFEHCVWGANRHVLYKGRERIPARLDFNELLNTQRRCDDCGAVVEGDRCLVDSSHIVRTIDERVRGWVGVQRYDDPTHFGIDLIRRGRAIRVLEKGAFFKFSDDLGNEVSDYPIDGPYGRIVGEVHLDHVPVDFAKQDFDRSSAEWSSAMEFLRGNSSLQARQPGADSNTSPVMRIYTGYRRVRGAGLSSMYMGYIGEKGDARRISRDVEKEFLEKFQRKLPGYYDDAKWWEKVEEASQKPETSDKCPECDFQIPRNAEVCDSCGHIIKGKKCIKCEQVISRSARNCPHCEAPQTPEGPWACAVCGYKSNPPDAESCTRCEKPRGAQNPFSLDVLRDKSVPDDALSVPELYIELADGTPTQKIDLKTMSANLRGDGFHLPVVCFNSTNPRLLEVFIDKSHAVFDSLQARPEHIVAIECASILFAEAMSLRGRAEHTISNLHYKIVEKYWGDALSDESTSVREDILSLLDDIREKMSGVLQDLAEDIYRDMSRTEIDAMLSSMREVGADITQLTPERTAGAFMRHIPPEAVVSAFKQHTGYFFGGNIWGAPWEIPGVPQENAESMQQEVKGIYLNCMEDCVAFLRYRKPPNLAVQRARLSHAFLLKDLVS